MIEVWRNSSIIIQFKIASIEDAGAVYEIHGVRPVIIVASMSQCYCSELRLYVGHISPHTLAV